MVDKNDKKNATKLYPPAGTETEREREREREREGGRERERVRERGKEKIQRGRERELKSRGIFFMSNLIFKLQKKVYYT